MRKPIKVERMAAEDAPQMAEWMEKLAQRNNIDPDIFNYPCTVVLKASNGKPVMYMPFQTVFVLESLAINPEATNAENAIALKELLSIVEWEGRKAGHGELYFLCADEQTKAFAEHHGLEKVEGLTLYRRKI